MKGVGPSCGWTKGCYPHPPVSSDPVKGQNPCQGAPILNFQTLRQHTAVHTHTAEHGCTDPAPHECATDTASVTAAHSYIQPKEQPAKMHMHTKTQTKPTHWKRYYGGDMSNHRTIFLIPVTHTEHASRNPTITQMHTPSSPALEPPAECTLPNCAVLSIPEHHPQTAA